MYFQLDFFLLSCISIYRYIASKKNKTTTTTKKNLSNVFKSECIAIAENLFFYAKENINKNVFICLFLCINSELKCQPKLQKLTSEIN